MTTTYQAIRLDSTHVRLQVPFCLQEHLLPHYVRRCLGYASATKQPTWRSRCGGGLHQGGVVVDLGEGRSHTPLDAQHLPAPHNSAVSAADTLSQSC